MKAIRFRHHPVLRIRRLLASALCILLTPLLAAQLAAQQTAGAVDTSPSPAQTNVTLDRINAIQFISPSGVPFAKIKPGTQVRFTLDRGVYLGHGTIIPASTTLDGVVVRVIHASRFRNRAAQMFLRVTETIAGTPTDVVLSCYDPGDNLDNSFNAAGAQFTVVGILNTFAIVALILMVLLLLSI